MELLLFIRFQVTMVHGPQNVSMLEIVVLSLACGKLRKVIYVSIVCHHFLIYLVNEERTHETRLKLKLLYLQKYVQIFTGTKE